MYKTYNATVRGNTIEWETDSPPADTALGVKVQITVMENPSEEEEAARRKKLRAAFDKLASLPSSFPDDLVEWQREVRQDRPLPGERIMLLDSNIVIYTGKLNYEFLRDMIEENPCSVSTITRVEVLGFHKITDIERIIYEEIFDKLAPFPLSSDVVEEAVKLRQQRKMSLGDALIAATAIVFDLPLVTRNTDDFKWIPNLKLVNPFDNLP